MGSVTSDVPSRVKEMTLPRFVLMTNFPRDARWMDEAIVREYKEVIKNPKIAGPMDVNNPSGIPLEVCDHRTSLNLPAVAF